MKNAIPMHPTRPLKVGYALPETEFRRGPEVARWSEPRDMAQRAEDVGFDSLWIVDRLLFPGGDEFSGFTIAETHGGWEAWSLMAALAAVTTRIELGQIVTNNLFRNPALLAKDGRHRRRDQRRPPHPGYRSRRRRRRRADVRFRRRSAH